MTHPTTRAQPTGHRQRLAELFAKLQTTTDPSERADIEREIEQAKADMLNESRGEP